VRYRANMYSKEEFKKAKNIAQINVNSFTSDVKVKKFRYILELYYVHCCENESERNNEYSILAENLNFIFKVKSDEFFESNSIVDMTDLKQAVMKLIQVFNNP